MSKRGVAYVKPQDPSFLAKLKAQIGPSNEPTIDTKRQKLENYSDSDSESEHIREDEKPQIVVLKNGDLTAEEVQRIEKEAAEAPADLNQRVIFRVRKKPNDNTSDQTPGQHETTLKPSTALKKSTTSTTKTNTTTTIKSSTSKRSHKSDSSKNRNNTKLSFNPNDEDEEEE